MGVFQITLRCRHFGREWCPPSKADAASLPGITESTLVEDGTVPADNDVSRDRRLCDWEGGRARILFLSEVVDSLSQCICEGSNLEK